eukprot:TRINITY_DN1853_c0_g1_i1.p1 TRINITY_DN1853_c0_g1~~TRINITY_DN1853_c0_g1_i1.p1  ORF type:complete len:135 (+),score=26.93 TRINITY_DN1853_c0_g1_i1:43-405(+)
MFLQIQVAKGAKGKYQGLGGRGSLQIKNFYHTGQRLESRKIPAPFALNDQQLCVFGGKRSLQKRLTDLGLSPVGYRGVLRHRLKEHLESLEKDKFVPNLTGNKSQPDTQLTTTNNKKIIQ